MIERVWRLHRELEAWCRQRRPGDPVRKGRAVISRRGGLWQQQATQIRQLRWRSLKRLRLKIGEVELGHIDGKLSRHCLCSLLEL